MQHDHVHHHDDTIDGALHDKGPAEVIFAQAANQNRQTTQLQCAYTVEWPITAGFLQHIRWKANDACMCCLLVRTVCTVHFVQVQCMRKKALRHDCA